jgi:hypothetical protein
MALNSSAVWSGALIHPGPAVALVMNMKPVLSGRQPGELGSDHQAMGAVHKGHRHLQFDPPDLLKWWTRRLYLSIHAQAFLLALPVSKEQAARNANISAGPATRSA